MDTLEENFIREISSQIISSNYQSEEEYFEIIFEEMKRYDFRLGAKSDTEEIPLGLGIEEIIEVLKTPLIISVLSSVWAGLMVEVIKEAIDEMLIKTTK